MPRQGKPAPQPPAGGDTEEELMVVVLKLKGSGDTLKRGFDTLNNAFQAMIVPSAAPANRKAMASNGTTTKQVGAASTTEEQAEEPEVIEAEYTDEAEDEAETPPAKPSRPRSPYYKFLTDFKLDVSDEHWQDFAARKNPKTESEKYLTAAEWITKNAGLETFSANHIFSCFRAMKWGEIRDFTQPMRAMKAKDSYFENPSRKRWKLTGLGLKAAATISNSPSQ